MKYVFYFFLAVLFLSCRNGEEEADAYGNFQAVEILISSESSGKILGKYISEGREVKNGQVAYLIDTVQPFLKRQELLAKREAVLTKKLNLQAQISVLEEQKLALERDIARLQKMLKDGAASQKQVDDLNTQYSMINKQIDQVTSNFASISAEVKAVDAGIRQVDDLLDRSRVTVPMDGWILETYAEAGESVAPGKPLFKMADLDTMELKAYFTADQLASIKLGDLVEVMIDDGSGGMRSMDGRVSWISRNAEFTPKIIQTREERISLVYAVKISVPNEGNLRINMPGEVKLKN